MRLKLSKELVNAETSCQQNWGVGTSVLMRGSCRGVGRALWQNA